MNARLATDTSAIRNIATAAGSFAALLAVIDCMIMGAMATGMHLAIVLGVFMAVRHTIWTSMRPEPVAPVTPPATSAPAPTVHTP